MAKECTRDDRRVTLRMSPSIVTPQETPDVESAVNNIGEEVTVEEVEPEVAHSQETQNGKHLF